MRSPLSTAGFALQGAGASAVESATRGGSRFRVRLCTFSQHPHWHPLRHLSRTYFQVLGSPREPVKLLKVLNRRELARSHSTTELLPLGFTSINDAVPAEQTWRSGDGYS
jgi:hypothetical protein